MKNKNSLRSNIGLMMMLALGSCAQKHTRGHEFWLSDEAIEKCTESAEQGDSYAAFKLWSHFTFALNSNVQAKRWERQATDGGWIVPLKKQDANYERILDEIRNGKKMPDIKESNDNGR